MASDWPDIQSSVPDWLIEFPQLLRLIEQLGLDYSCGGKSLGAAADEAGLDPQAVLEQLRTLAHGEPSKAPQDK
jgi:regulator of cell morphogenesis and NO signaling